MNKLLQCLGLTVSIIGAASLTSCQPNQADVKGTTIDFLVGKTQFTRELRSIQTKVDLKTFLTSSGEKRLAFYCYSNCKREIYPDSDHKFYRVYLVDSNNKILADVLGTGTLGSEYLAELTKASTSDKVTGFKANTSLLDPQLEVARVVPKLTPDAIFEIKIK